MSKAVKDQCILGLYVNTLDNNQKNINLKSIYIDHHFQSKPSKAIYVQ